MAASRSVELTCPYCEEQMRPVKASCDSCGVAVEAVFKAPRIAQLTGNEAAFLAEFILAGFSIKKLEERVGMSYPAVRSRLNAVIGHMQDISAGATKRQKVLDRLESGELRADEAIQMIEALK